MNKLYNTIEVKKEELADALNNITDKGGSIINIIPDKYEKINGYNYSGRHLKSVLVIYKA